MNLTKMRPPRRSIAAKASAGVVFSALLLAGCSQAEKDQAVEVSVQVTPAQRGSISQVISSEAVVFPIEKAVVSPKITAPITEFRVQRGSRVKKGQVLAVLENKDLAGQLEASKGNFEQADAGYVTSVGSTIPQQVQKAELDAAAAKAAFDAQQKMYDSRKELLRQGAIPQREMDAAEVALAQSRTVNEVARKQLADLQRLGKAQELKSAHGSRLSAEGQMRSAEAMLSYSQIRSPIDGVVTDRPLYAGDLATANQPILTVMNLSRLIAKSHIPQSEAATLKVGNPAEIKVKGLFEPLKGQVTLVSPALDPGSTTIEVWVEASKSNAGLKPGMTVEVSMTARTITDAIVVPTSAVFKSPEGGTEYVVLAGADQKAHWKIVQIGVRNVDNAQIMSGINAGDPVISSGGYALPDETKIKIEAAPPPGNNAGDKSGTAEKNSTAGGSAKPNSKGKG
ncbi:MAG: efflux RND transporter periplasmic adaptor subunit [Candidatus Acidiferrales bacterium]